MENLLNEAIAAQLRESAGNLRTMSEDAALHVAMAQVASACVVAFDWPDRTGVLAKMDEETAELREAISTGDRKKVREEIGDLLFVLVNRARLLRVDPEDALRRTIEKFISRFNYIEISLLKKGKTIHQSNLIEMDSLWEEAKRKKRKK